MLAAARTGAEWAWTEIYRDLAPPVHTYLRARGAREPEELVGEVFIQVVRSLDRFDGGEANFRTFVLSIAHRRFVDDVRARTRRPVEPVPADELPEGPGPADPEEAALDAIMARRAVRLIRTLSPDQQDVLLLRIVADLTVEEVAGILGKRPGAVKALQRRGLAALKKKLSKEGVSL